MKKFKVFFGELESVYEASSREEALLKFFDDVCGAKSYDEYKTYCESVSCSVEVNIKEFI